MPRKGQAREAKCPKCLDVIREMIPWREWINTRGWRGLLKSDICFFFIMLHKQIQLKQKMHYIRISHVWLLFFSTVYDKPLVNRAYVPNYQYLYQIPNDLLQECWIHMMSKISEPGENSNLQEASHFRWEAFLCN